MDARFSLSLALALVRLMHITLYITDRSKIALYPGLYPNPLNRLQFFHAQSCLHKRPKNACTNSSRLSEGHCNHWLFINHDNEYLKRIISRL